MAASRREDAGLGRVRRQYTEARNYYTKFFEDNKLDALCGPADGFPWTIDLINGDHFTGYGAYSPAAVCVFRRLPFQWVM